MLKKFNFWLGAFQYRSLNPGSCKNFGYFGSAKSNFHYALILEYLAFNETLKIDKLYFLVFIERKKQNKNKSKTKQNFFQIGFVFEVERV